VHHGTIEPVQRLLTSGYARLAVLTSMAALAAYLLAEAIPHTDPIPAAITAVVATRATFHHAAKETVFQVLGALLGAAIALAIVSLIGTGPIVIFLLVLLCFVLARVLHLATPAESPNVAAAIAVTVIIVVGAHFNSENAVERFLGVAVGAACALVASFLATPTKDTRLLRSDLNTLQDALAELLMKVSRGVRTSPDAAEAAQWREEAVELRDQSLGLEARLEDLRAHRRWSPRIDPEDLDDLKRRTDATSIMSSRVLTITSDLRAAARGGASAQLPQSALNPLADLIAKAAGNMAAEDPETSVGMTSAQEAVRLAEQTSDIALIGGIVSNINRINQVSVDASDSEDHSAT